MAETPDDERPTTGIAGDERPTAGLASPPPKKSRILTYLLTLITVSIVGPLVFYLVFWRFEPTAQFHIPGGTTIAVRFDARELYLFRPFREQILPILSGASSDPMKPSKLDQIRSETSVDLGTDLREVILATSDGTSWVAIAGGRFLRGVRRGGRYIDGCERAMEKEPAYGDWVAAGDVLSGPRGVAIAQADDGTLLLATSADLARAALPATDDYRELWLASSGAVSFAVQRGALEHVAESLRAQMPEAVVFEKLERVTGWLTLGERESRLSLELIVRPGEPVDAVATQAEAFLQVATKRVAEDPELETLRPFFATTRVQVRQSAVMVSGMWKGPESEAAIKRLAALLSPFQGGARALH